MEVDDHYEPPAAEAGACKAVQRDTQWKSARSDTERLLARFVLTLSGSAGFAPFSYTLRDRFSGPHARTASWATFYFPQNSFVWESKKIDSRPYKSNTKTPDFLATRAQSMQLGETNRMVALIVVCDAAGRSYSGLKLPARGGTSGC